MKFHAQKMLQFASSFKALLFACGLENTDQIDQFLATENPATFGVNFWSMLNQLEFKDGFFLANLRHCTCSEIQPIRENQATILNASSYTNEEGFCYHAPLTTEIAQKYLQLIEFCQTSLQIQGF